MARALPGYTLGSVESLAGGKTNRNYLLRFANRDEAMVLRIYGRGREACEKELALWRLTRHAVPARDIVHADVDGLEHAGPHMIYRFVPGFTFQEIKKTGNSEDLAGAAFAIGAALARIHRIDSSQFPVAARRRLDESFEQSLASPILKQRMGRMEQLHDLLSRWRPKLRELDATRTLVHGDFNNRNTIVRRVGDGWMVAAILDWELAFAGAPLWDAARFICYEHADRPCREPFFSNGYQEHGGRLPEDWPRSARLINVVSAVNSLADAGTPGEFVEELRELVEGIVDSGV